MKTIPEALKELYVAMGGTAADVANLTVTPDMIEKVAEIYHDEKGDTLPKVTSANNGNVLTVVNGAWDKAAAVFNVGISAALDTDTGDFVWTFDKTYSEIMEAHESGKVLRARVSIEGISGSLFTTTCSIVTNAVYFSTVAMRSPAVVYAHAGISSSGTTTGAIVPLAAQ